MTIKVIWFDLQSIFINNKIVKVNASLFVHSIEPHNNLALVAEQQYLTISKNVSGYECNHGSPSGERHTASPRGRYWGTLSAWPVPEAYIYKNTTCWPATAYDVTTGTIQYWAPGEYIIRFFVWSLRPKHGTQPRGRSVSFPTWGTMVTYVTWDVPLHGNFELRPLVVAIGECYTHATMLRGVQANFAQKASTKPTLPG